MSLRKAVISWFVFGPPHKLGALERCVPFCFDIAWMKEDIDRWSLDCVLMFRRGTIRSFVALGAWAPSLQQLRQSLIWGIFTYLSFCVNVFGMEERFSHLCRPLSTGSSLNHKIQNVGGALLFCRGLAFTV